MVAVHSDFVELLWTSLTSTISPRRKDSSSTTSNNFPGCELLQACTQWLVFEHLLHLENLAGGVFCGCKFPKHLGTFDQDFSLWSCWKVSQSLDLSCDFSLKFPLLLRDFPFAMPSTCTGVELNLPTRMFCCCLTVSLCLTKFFPKFCSFVIPQQYGANELFFLTAKIAVPCQAIQICDNTIHWFSHLLTFWVEFCSFKDDVFFLWWSNFRIYPSLLQNSSPVRRWIRMRWIYRRLVHPFVWKLMFLLDFHRFFYQAQ